MTASTTTGGAPLIVGLGGTLRANSSTERALRYCLESVERQGGRTKLFSGDDLDLPMYAPHELARTPQGAGIGDCARDADAVIVGSPGYHGAISGLVKNALDYIEDLREDPRVYLDNTPWGCISCAYGWQAAVGTLTPAAFHRACAAGLADPARCRDQLRRPDLGCRRRVDRPLRAEPTRHVGHPDPRLRPRRVGNRVIRPERKTVLVDGLVTGYLEAGQGDPVVLLHGGEFGVTAEIAWERNIAALAQQHRVLAPDMLGFGDSAKVIDFTDGRGMRIRHIARFCEVVGVQAAHFVGNSMGAVNLFVDATSVSPVLPARSMVTICGGGEIQRNEYSAALYDYDATLPAMRRIVEALFYDPSYPADDGYVKRRYESSIVPGAWEALAAARFRRPGLEPPPLPSSVRAYERIAAPTLVVEGGGDKLLPPGWAGGHRRPDRGWPVRSDPRCRSLPADRAGRDRQRTAARFLRRRGAQSRRRATKGVGDMTNELAGKVAIVTGGSSGIGRGIVERFAAEGAKVVIADVDRQGGEELAATCGADSLYQHTDVSEPEQVSDLISVAVRDVRRTARHGQQRGDIEHPAHGFLRR